MTRRTNFKHLAIGFLPAILLGAIIVFLVDCAMGWVHWLFQTLAK